MSTNKSNENNLQKRYNTPSNSPINTSDNTELPKTLIMDVYHIIRDLVLFFCRRIIFGPAKFKLLVAFFIITIGSIFRANGLSPDSYFSSKKNIFNLYFAKLGWAWTIGLLGPFIYLTLITTHNYYQILTRHLVRLLVATGVWYIITFLFVRLEEYTGSCEHVDMRSASRKVCVSEGHTWQEGHDFSGHTFLLLYALLIINEEVKSYDKGTKKVDQANATSQNPSGDTSANIDQQNWELVSKIIRILYVLLAALTILWEFMLLSTALYFHETVYKLLAGVVAVFFWYITYYVWYRPDTHHHSLLYPATPN